MPFVQVPLKQSSNIKGAEYDGESKTLRVHFLKGGSYDYPGVEQDKVDDFSAADSPGKFHFNFIKGYYQHNKVG